MWEYEYSAETTASREELSRLWADVDNWCDWNADIEAIELQGPLAEGSSIAMTPAGQETVHLPSPR